MTSNRSMVSSATWLMLHVIKFKPTQLPISHSRTHKCFERLIIRNSLKQWRSKLAFTRIIVTGISCCKKTYLLALRQSLPFGCSNASSSPTEHSISIRPKYVLMEVNRLGVKTTGTYMLLLLHGLVFSFSLLSPRFMVLNWKASTLFLHFLRHIWMYRFTWSFLQKLVQLMPLMGTSADTFLNLTRAFIPQASWLQLVLEAPWRVYHSWLYPKSSW